MLAITRAGLWGSALAASEKLPTGPDGVYTFIARSRVVSYVDRYDDKSPKEALGMFRSRIRHMYRHAVVFTWSDLTLDRSRKLVGLQSPVTCVARVDCDSKPNLEN